MGKYNLDLHDDTLDEITLNKFGDKIFISADDANLWKRFSDGYKKIEKLENEFGNKADEIEKKYPENDRGQNSELFIEASKLKAEFCEKAIDVIDGIFGEGSAKKSFREYYESIPGFIPDEGKFMAFFDVMTPIIEDIFKRKIEKDQKESKQRMAKYQPQDHKRKGSK